MAHVEAPIVKEIRHFCSQAATWPAQVSHALFNLIRKMKEILSRFIWPVEPYNPTVEEQAVARKVEYLKRGSSAPVYKSYRLISPKSGLSSFPTESLHLLIDHFIQREIKKARETVSGDREQQALSAMLPLFNALGGVFARKQADFLKSVTFASDLKVAPLSEPVEALCRVGKEFLLVAYESGKEAVREAQTRELLTLLEPFLPAFFELMLTKLGNILERLEYAELFDELLKSLSKEAKILMALHQMQEKERLSMLTLQRLQREEPDDPRINGYLEKLSRGEKGFLRLPEGERQHLLHLETEKTDREVFYPYARKGRSLGKNKYSNRALSTRPCSGTIYFESLLSQNGQAAFRRKGDARCGELQTADRCRLYNHCGSNCETTFSRS